MSYQESHLMRLKDGQTVLKNVLLTGEIYPGTEQSVVYDSSGNISQILHKRSGTTLRTDAVTFGTNTVTEVRTLSTGESLTIVDNLSTLKETVTYSAGT